MNTGVSVLTLYPFGNQEVDSRLFTIRFRVVDSSGPDSLRPMAKGETLATFLGEMLCAIEYGMMSLTTKLIYSWFAHEALGADPDPSHRHLPYI